MKDSDLRMYVKNCISTLDFHSLGATGSSVLRAPFQHFYIFDSVKEEVQGKQLDF